jgi:putative aldouronate transport system substrate-binding protein
LNAKIRLPGKIVISQATNDTNVKGAQEEFTMAQNRFFAVLLTAILIFSFYGCKKQRQQYSLAELMEQTAVTAAPGQFPLTDEKAELTVMIQKPPYIADLNKNEAAAWYEEYTNDHVTYVQVPSQSAREVTNLQIAAGDYPDIIISAGMNLADEVSYADQGIFIPIDELIAKQGYWYQKAIEQIPELPGAIIQSDGHIYGLPNINQAFHTFFLTKAWLNQDWLDKLGLATPQTTDEFYEMLKAFATQDPNGNGKADEIPMMGHLGATAPYAFLLNSFVYFNPAANFLAMHDGKVSFVANTEEFREGLRYVARLVDEGLLNRVSFTQNVDQAKMLGTNPDAPLVGVFTNSTWWDTVGQRTDTPDHRADSYVALPPLEGPHGVRFSPQTNNGFDVAHAHITDKCKDPILAFRWLEAMYSDEATMNTQFGLKGIMHDDPDPGALGINRKPALWKLMGISTNIDDNPYFIVNIFLGNRYSDLRLGEQTDWSNPDAKFEQEPKLYLETLEKYYPFRPQPGEFLPLNINHTISESTEIGNMVREISTYVEESIVAFVTGTKNLDRDWDTYVREFQRLGLPRVLEVKQIAYDRQYGN